MGQVWEAARNLAWAVNDYLLMQGHWTECITTSKAGLAATQNLGHLQDEASFFSWLSLAYYSLGQVERAIEYYDQALAIAREIGDRHMEGNALCNLGNAYSDLGQVERAIEYLEQSVAILEQIKSPDAEQVRGWLAELEDG